jgi:3-oxoadipate enol-lactonase
MTAAPAPAGRSAHTERGSRTPAIAYTVHAAHANAAPSTAPTLMLAHALGCDRHLWDGLIPALTARHRVITYDHRGHGASDSPTGPCTLADLADDALRVLDAALPPGEAVVYIGLSLGGMVGQQLALAQPQRVRALVAANTTSSYPEAARTVWRERIATLRAHGLEAIADATMQRWFTPPFLAAEPATVAAVRQRVVSQNLGGYIACCEAIAKLDLTAQLPRIACPTLVIAGAEDAGTPPAMSERIAAQIPGARYLLLPQAAHLSVIERLPAFRAALLDFLATL